MIKSLLSIIGSIGITVALCLRVLKAESFTEIVVIGSLSLFTGAISLYLLFENQIKSRKQFYQKKDGANSPVTYYAMLVVLLLLMEIFLFFVPLENSFLKIPKIFLMLFFLLGIIVLSVMIYLERAKQ